MTVIPIQYERTEPTNWHPRPVHAVVAYDCPICGQLITSYTETGPTVDTNSGETVRPAHRVFRPCCCTVIRSP